MAVAFKKLTNCDSSDLSLWANSKASGEFMKEVMTERAKALRALIKSPTEESASIVRAYDRVAGLMEEARGLK